MIGLGELTSAASDARGIAGAEAERPHSTAACLRFIRYRSTGMPRTLQAVRAGSRAKIVYAIAGRKERSIKPWVSPAKAYGLMQVTAGMPAR